MKPSVSSNKPGSEITLLIGAFIISFSGVYVKLSGVAPTVSAFYRLLFGGLILLIPCFIKGEFKLRHWKLNALAILCGVLFSLDLFAWHHCIQYVGPGLATILGNFQVFILAIAGFLFFKEKISLVYFLSLGLAFLGLFLLVGIDVDIINDTVIIGVGLGLATAVFYSGFLLTLRSLQGKEEKPPLFYYQVILLFTAALILGTNIQLTGQSFAIPDLKALLSLLALGLFSQSIGWVIITKSLPRIRASLAGFILLLQPALSFIWDVLLFDRPTGLIGWIGLLVVLAAIYLSSLRPAKADRS